MTEPEVTENGMPGTWKNRRRVIFSTLLFCAGVVFYLLGWGEDTKLNETIASGTFLLAASVIGSYVFGVVWNDNRKIGNSSTGQPK